MENQLHPELARELGVTQEQKKYDIHPTLQNELMSEGPVEEQTIETADNVETVETTSAPEPVRDIPSQTESPKDRDWRAVRQQAEEAKALKREAEALARERDFYRQQAEQKQQPAQEDYRTEYEKQLSLQMEEQRQQTSRLEKEVAQAKQQAAISRAEQRLAKDYPDIYDVVSDENIKRLEYEYPHLYNSVIASSDVYTVGSAAYEMIMAKGIYKKPVNTLKQITESNINRNASKPRSVSTVSPQAGETPISKAGNFMGNSISSEDERKALWSEMLGAARNRI